MPVVAITLKYFVFLESDLDVQVAWRPPIGARLTIAGAANAHAVVNTRRDFDFECFLFFELTLTTA